VISILNSGNDTKMSNQAYADPNPMRFKERDDIVKDINPSQNMINQLSQKYNTNNV